MSADVETMHQQWKEGLVDAKRGCLETTNESLELNMKDQSPSRPSVLPSWKRDLLLRKKMYHHQQHKNGLLINNNTTTNNNLDIPDFDNQTESKKKDPATTSYFYPAVGGSRSGKSSGYCNDKVRGDSSPEKEEREGEGERILPVHRNPILLQDLEKRSKEPIQQPLVRLAVRRSAIEEAFDLPEDIERDSVFDEETEKKGIYDEEVVYGRGFVHRLLQKFSHLTQQEDQQFKSRSPSKTRSSDSEPTLATTSELRLKSESPEKIVKSESDMEGKSFSDGEDKIEPVSNTLCMFEKLFCSRRKPQDDEKSKSVRESGHVSPTKANTISTTKQISPKPSLPDKPLYHLKNISGKVTPDHHHPRHHRGVVPNKKEKAVANGVGVNQVRRVDEITYPMRNIEDSCVWGGSKVEGSGSKVEGSGSKVEGSADVVLSPVDVKLVKSIFEPRQPTGPHKEQQSIPKRLETPESVPERKYPFVVDPKISKSTVKTISNATETTTTAINNTTKFSATPNNSLKSSGDHQLRQHKRHSSKDYLEIKPGSNTEGTSNDIPATVGTSRITSKSVAAAVPRPGKLLIRSSNLGAAVDVGTLPKYNDIRTGEFVPASKVYFDDAADENDDKNFNFEFQGAGIPLERSLLAKTRNSKKLKIQFDDCTTVTHEYPSEQSLIDWFNDSSNSGIKVKRDTFFI